jgi:molecular chaperone HscB
MHSTDYFAIFSLPRKLWIEMNALDQRFLQMSWKWHPDNFVNASQSERESSLRRSSELNDAYRTLKEPVTRVEYLLAIEGARKEGEQKQQAPPELLEEVFELNESLDELRAARAGGGDLAVVKQRLEAAQKNFRQKLQELDTDLFAAAKEWDATVDVEASGGKAGPAREGIKQRLNELLNHRAYIRNLVENVQKELS